MNGYVSSMRELIGHKTLLMCGASVIAEDERGNVLLQRRRDNGCWAYSGGAVELDEHVEDAARRELKEETGLEVDELVMLGVFSGPETHYVYPNRDEVSVVEITYVGRGLHGKLIPQEEEVTELRFFPPDQIPEPFSPPVRATMSAYLKTRGINWK